MGECCQTVWQGGAVRGRGKANVDRPESFVGVMVSSTLGGDVLVYAGGTPAH